MSTNNVFTRDEVLAWVTASCERQGVPLIVRDPGVVGQLATLLGTALAPAPVRPSTRTGSQLQFGP